MRIYILLIGLAALLLISAEIYIATIRSQACEVCSATLDEIENEIMIETETDFETDIETESTVRPLSTEEAIVEHIEIQTTEVVTEEPKHYSYDDAAMIARLMYSECRGVKSQTQKACVAWTVLNRVDAGEGTIARVITRPNQFAYNPKVPIVDDLYDLAVDVLDRWSAEKSGEADVGRVLPLKYRFFHGDGKRNYFKDAYKNGNIWDYSLDSPYES